MAAAAKAPAHPSRRRRMGIVLGSVGILLAGITLLHYLTPQIRLLPFLVNMPLSRHTVERFLFVLPVIMTAWGLRWKGGVSTLLLAVLLMLPRAIWISASPIDALLEIAATATIGGLSIWALEAQMRQSELDQAATAQLGALNAVSEEITSVLDLDEILATVLRIAKELVGADGGGIALADLDGTGIRYPYLDNLPQELIDISIAQDQGVAGQVITTSSPFLVENYPAHPNADPAFVAAGLLGIVSVPIVSGDRAFGALTLVTTSQKKRFSRSDIDILSGIGRQAAIAIENARLYEGMRGYARRMVQAQEEERERIARELHDETIQMLIVISRRLDLIAAQSISLSDQDRQSLRSTQDLLRDTQTGIRRFVQGLRPPTLEHLGLVPAIRSLINDLRNEHELTVELECLGEQKRLAREKELALYRITQEAFNNIRQHARATKVSVRLTFEADRVQITIQDNGKGFIAPQRRQDIVSLGRLGLTGMDERARSQGGTVTLRSEPEQGTIVIVDVPTSQKKPPREAPLPSNDTPSPVFF